MRGILGFGLGVTFSSCLIGLMADGYKDLKVVDAITGIGFAIGLAVLVVCGIFHEAKKEE